VLNLWKVGIYGVVLEFMVVEAVKMLTEELKNVSERHTIYMKTNKFKRLLKSIK